MGHPWSGQGSSAHHLGGSQQSSSVPAAAVSSGHRRIVGARYRRAVAADPASTAQCDRAHGRSARHRYRGTQRAMRAWRHRLRLSADRARRHPCVLRTSGMGRTCARFENTRRCLVDAASHSVGVRSGRARRRSGAACGMAELCRHRRRPDRCRTRRHAGRNRPSYLAARIPSCRSTQRRYSLGRGRTESAGGDAG